MKTAKKLTAIILCIAMFMSFATISSFALEISDTVEWSEDWDYDGIIDSTEAGILKDKLTEGANKITASDDEWFFYEFEAEKAGCYIINTFYGYVAEKYENGKAIGHLVPEWMNKGELYYFSEGTKLIRFYNVSDEEIISIEYYGEITNIDLSNISNEELINHINTSVYEEDGKYYCSTDKTFEVKFSTGKTLEPDTEYTFDCIGIPNMNGETRLEVDFMGFKKEFTADIYDITYYIDSIEVDNLDSYTEVYEYYDGYHYTPKDLGDAPEYVTVNFTDGTSTTIGYYYNYDEEVDNTKITLPNGLDCYISSYITEGCNIGLGEDNYDNYFVLSVADHDFVVRWCDVHAVSFSENFERCKDNVVFYIRAEIEHVNRCILMLLTGGDFTFWFEYLFDTYYISGVFEEISMFFNYYFSF